MFKFGALCYCRIFALIDLMAYTVFHFWYYDYDCSDRDSDCKNGLICYQRERCVS